jgi:DNA helicase II / ATP-dependent DNA helicase PcrA
MLPAGFVPSLYQAAIFDATKAHEYNIVVNATAGSGKSKTIEVACRFVPGNKNVLTICFNAPIAKELAGKLPSGVTVKTFNALGHGAWMKAYPKASFVENKKLNPFVFSTVPFAQRAFQSTVRALVSKAKAHGLVPDRAIRMSKVPLFPQMTDTDRNWLFLAEKFNIELPSFYGQVLEWAREVLTKCVLDLKSFDFDDQIYMPVVYKVPFTKFDVVLVDEVQDSNAVNIHMFKSLAHVDADGNMLPPKDGGTQFIFVGDSSQSLYAFRGADSDAMDNVKEAFNCKALPLTITYRCPVNVVNIAKHYDSRIEAAPNAPVGIVANVSNTAASVNYLAGDLIVCRSNAPLLKLAYQLMAAQKRVRIQGRNFHQEIWNQIKLLKCDNIEDIIPRLNERVEMQLSRMDEDDQTAIENLKDKAACITIVVSNSTAKTLVELEEQFKAMFEGDDKDCIKLSSIHRCVDESTLVDTGGLHRIKDIPTTGRIYTHDGEKDYNNKVVLEPTKGFKITTRSGYEVIITPEHGMLSWRGGEHVRVDGENLRVGDWLRLKMGGHIDPTVLPSIPCAPTNLDVRATVHNIPSVITEELAELLGLLVADGTIYRRGFRLKKSYQSVVDRTAQLVRTLFKMEPKLSMSEGVPTVEVNSTQLAQWLLKFDGLAPNQKSIPSCILSAPLRIQAAFLKGLFEDGTVNEKDGFIDHVHLENKDHSLTGAVQVMLLRFGIVSARRYHPSHNGHEISTLYIYGQNAVRFRDTIGFVSPEKNLRMQGDFATTERSYIVPLSRADASAMASALAKHDKGNVLTRGSLSRATCYDVLETLPLPFLKERLTWHYEKIKKIEEVEMRPMCVTVPDGGRFLQNGFDGFNCKGQEADRVFVLEHEVTSNKIISFYEGAVRKGSVSRDVADKAIEQEKNCSFVAVTRAKKELYFIDAGYPSLPRVKM